MTRYQFAEVKMQAAGKWLGILSASGIEPAALNGRHQPCPGCGGSDRFRYIDQKQDGFFVCGGGGERTAGDGFALLQHVHGWSAVEALKFVAGYLGIAGREITQSDRDAYRRRKVLEALAHEVEVWRIAIADQINGRALSSADLERERLAVARMKNAMAVLYGE